MSGAPRLLEVRRLGRVDYSAAHSLQEELVAARVAGTIGDTLVLCEHEPVVTVGRGAGPEVAAGVGMEVIETERGGEATYHGPGQVVIYPIIALPEGQRDLHRYLRDLEEVVISVLAEFEIVGRRVDGLTGVWVGEKKIASVGVAVRRWVAWHGLAINVHTRLEAFNGFQPCGLAPETMTRLADLAELPPGNMLVEVLVVKHFIRIFGFDLPPPAGRSEAQSGWPELPLFPG